jgi:hypothetical protein
MWNLFRASRPHFENRMYVEFVKLLNVIVKVEKEFIFLLNNIKEFKLEPKVLKNHGIWLKISLYSYKNGHALVKNNVMRIN